ncbi:MAG: hypothetical protein IKT41_00660 [Clostridia bacterium]|nr:hypothetical protein [Clostridia bacterium]
MFLVGVISENKEIIKWLKQNFKKNEADIIDLNSETIENFKNVKFDIILISNLKNYEESIFFKKVLINSDICVINADVKENLKFLEYIKGVVITYGFNSKSTITLSSVEDNKISVCIQRAIKNIKGEIIEPIEYVQIIEKIKNVEITDIIGIKTIEILLAKKKI